MTDTSGALAAHEAFERDGDEFRLTTATFDVTAIATDDRVRVQVVAPTLDAAVEGETVPDVIEDDWFDTFQRRVTDVGGAIRGDATPPEATHEDTIVVVESDVTSPRPAEDAKAVADFVEATWFQGVVPGYDYVSEVAAVRDRARSAAGDEATSP